MVHSDDGLDEISSGAPTQISELKDDKVTTHTVQPGQLGIEVHDRSELLADSVEKSLALIHGVLEDRPGAAREIVSANAGAAIYAAGLAESIAAGVEKARAAISSGAARERLDALVTLSRSFS